MFQHRIENRQQLAHAGGEGRRKGVGSLFCEETKVSGTYLSHKSLRYRSVDDDCLRVV
jgi:hypothetical protein